MEQEVWCEIDGFPNYLISDHGRLWNLKFDKDVIGHAIDGVGPMQYRLVDGDKVYHTYAHRLVATAFLQIDPTLGEDRVSHKDGNKLNNHRSNLIVKYRGRQA